MASKVAALVILNLLFFVCVSSHKSPCAPVTPSPVKPTPTSPAGKPPAKCPKDTLKLGVCADLLGGLVSLTVGTPPSSPCCTLLSGLADVEAALCLCTAIKANVLNIVKLDIPVAVSLLVNACGLKTPKGFKC
ncbi:14 kDa proline-rich protein DC2.15 [Thalictrum thalictroides]|uniref:14 kDa proline-rich protein DC2.15 n=1 Tax=Thalictrum thalictroides TaxID=46969 RepID=A0A7J6VXF8_THATH|nr:14 kDa proline-rich protein DC2.15 [Thalictrum thalictroides]